MSNQSPPRPKDKAIPVPPRDHPQHQEALIDEAVDETMVASDPISPYLKRGDKRSARPAASAPESDSTPDRQGREPESRPWQGWTRSEDVKPG